MSFCVITRVDVGTNDPYWTVDALRHYWSDLPDPKLVYQAPNAGHGAGGTREAKWASRPLELDPAHTRVSAEVATPTNGFTAFLVELAFTTPAKNDYRLSTQVQVTPDL